MSTSDHKTGHQSTCPESEHAKCGNCGLDWCQRHDPAPAALCPDCHGRGYTVAPWFTGQPTRQLAYRVEVRKVTIESFYVGAYYPEYASIADDQEPDDLQVVDVETTVWEEKKL